MRGENSITFSIVRYGNVLGSRGSVVPFFLENKEGGVIPITHPDMTRFNITLDEAVELILFALKNSIGGEVFIPKLSSYKIVDLAKAIAPGCKVKIVGVRSGEKLHEEMIAEHESYNTVELQKHYIILPMPPEYISRPTIEDVLKRFKGKRVKDGFKYNSGTNTKWLSVSDLRDLIKKNIDPNSKTNIK